MPREILVHLNVLAADRDERTANQIANYIDDAYHVGAESHEGSEGLTVAVSMAETINTANADLYEGVAVEHTEERLQDGARIRCTWTLPRFAGQDPWLVEQIPNTVHDFTRDLEQSCGAVRAAAVEQTGGGCETLIVFYQGDERLAVLTRAYEASDNTWDTDPVIPETADGPWAAGLYSVNSWQDGEPPSIEKMPLTKAEVIETIREWSTATITRRVERKNALPLHQADRVPDDLTENALDDLAEGAIEAACAHIAQMLRERHGYRVTGDFGPGETQTLDAIGRALTLAMLANRIES